jgi:hypothetical protein
MLPYLHNHLKIKALFLAEMEPVPRPPWHFDVTYLPFEVVYAHEREKCSYE